MRQQLEAQAAGSKELSSINESLRTEIAKCQLRMEGNQELVNETKGQNSQLVDENKRLSGEIVTLTKTIASLESSLKGNEQLIQQLQANLSSMEKSIEKAERESAEIKVERNDLRRALESSTGELNLAKEKVRELRDTSQEQSRVIKKLTNSK